VSAPRESVDSREVDFYVLLARPTSTFQIRPRETFLKKAGMKATQGFNISAFLHES